MRSADAVTRAHLSESSKMVEVGTAPPRSGIDCAKIEPQNLRSSEPVGKSGIKIQRVVSFGFAIAAAPNLLY
jgi:hypothetical protein